jgi:hypothetical protein
MAAWFTAAADHATVFANFAPASMMVGLTDGALFFDHQLHEKRRARWPAVLDHFAQLRECGR